MPYEWVFNFYVSSLNTLDHLDRGTSDDGFNMV